MTAFAAFILGFALGVAMEVTDDGIHDRPVW